MRGVRLAPISRAGDSSIGMSAVMGTAAWAARAARAAVRPLLLLAALVALVAGCARRAADADGAALSTIDGCAFGFQCTDGGCVWNGSRCDGIKNCQDGSDESRERCQGTALKLTVSNPKWVRVHYLYEHIGVVLLLCDTIDCAALWLWGATNPGRRMRYEAWVGCGLVGFPCRQKQNEESPDGWEAFPEEPIELIVEWNPPYVRAWWSGSLHKAQVEAKRSQNQLVVRPYNWAANMSVEFP